VNSPIIIPTSTVPENIINVATISSEDVDGNSSPPVKETNP